MAAKQFIRPEIIFVFIRVHSWLKTFRPSGSRATKSVSIRNIKSNHVGAGFPRPIASITDLGGEKGAPTLDCAVALNIPDTNGFCGLWPLSGPGKNFSHE